ncbi:NACHT domain-containing protein [Micromonospora sp. DT229]|uniref:NACHT domain-containing protein n=1 Tax=Micromonospora sp. DT229 TaxID=3393430 RepID=UPI003CFAE494
MDWGPARWRRLRSLTLVPLSIAIMLYAVGLLLKAFASGDDDEVARLAGYANIVALVLAPPALLVAIWSSSRTRTSRAEVLDLLAGAVTKQWSAEARRLDLDDRLEVTWKPLTAHDTTRTSGRRKSDQIRPPRRTLAEAFWLLPHRRLVLLGSAGAGKTVVAVRLVLELAREPRDGPVPVLMGLAGWDPSAEELDSWLARRLAENYPFLSSTSARDLLERGQVMPILDGLDEITPQLRAYALEKISATAVNDRPLVLTCRKQEYDTLVAAEALLVADASVWCLEPVGQAELERYLNRRRPRGDRHWRAVLDHIRAKPNGSLAAALSTPLMANMAHAVYSPAGADPAELLGFPDRDGVERHLLDAFLLRVYGPGSDRARQYLATLADLMGDGREFVWWKLHSAVSVLQPGCLLAISGGLFGGWIGSMVTLPPDAGWRRIIVVAAFSLLGMAYVSTSLVVERDGVGRRRVTAPQPRRLAWTFAKRGPGDGPFLHQPEVLDRLWLGLGYGTLAAVGVFFAYGSWDAGIILVAYFGLAGAGAVSAVLLAALYRWLSAPAPVERTASPISVLRQDRFAALLALPPHLVVGGVAGMYLGVDLSQRPMEQAVNVVAVVIGIAVGAVAWLGYTLTFTAWGWFWLTHTRLALIGALPWRLMRFLADAHRRKVLRQTGPVYEFRHSRLQDFLRTRND